jgi:thiol-disulfide isomerase/thioredoxin
MHLVASTEEFRERIRLAKGESTLVVVDYFAPWCHACKSLHPKLQNLARSYRHVTFLSVSLLQLMHRVWWCWTKQVCCYHQSWKVQGALQVNAGIDSLKAMCEEIGVPKLPYFHFLKGDNGVVAEFAANLTAQKLQQLRAQIAQHSAQWCSNTS